ncbi:hypothetical protein, conserved [Eimeria tenella]|uniref:Uncharacterized protein n=1 Tax=Eimeria tenella TaxID=5802 RepID=H9B947_EIMTE|nr:hypothetical protein, conserved [Eimeria tenella]AET50507.1 hypothetical protein [Eimeria tenella]CDJ37206.1 hypothetical protein, conserved [Eimeria tenella]|eukprot:XP_013228044.1 hypothetical protein, conserved [Eimeria tenella]
MKALQLLAAAPFAGLLLSSEAFAASASRAAAAAQAEAKSPAQAAAEGLQAVGELFKFLGENSQSLNARLDAVSDFIKFLLRELHPDGSSASFEQTIAAFDAAIDGEKAFNDTVDLMEDLAAEIREKNPEKDSELRQRMRTLAEKLRSITANTTSSSMAAFGVDVSDLVLPGVGSYVDYMVEKHADPIISKFEDYM